MGRAMAAFDLCTERETAPGTLFFREQDAAAPTTAILSDCWMVPFENALPVRDVAAFKGQRNFSGLWWCATNQRHVGFESWCERDRLMSLDFDPGVVGVSSQPFRVVLPSSLPQRTHVPDFFIRCSDGSAIVMDVRPDKRVKSTDQDVFDATAELCAGVGWSYRRVGDLPPIQLANLRWLAGYRHPRCLRQDIAAGVLARLVPDVPVPLHELATAAGDPVCVLPTLFHLLWTHRISADLESRVLGADTLVWIGQPR
ncbi:TnsA-like heteromeric transposase endonuclease subunit [Pseudarthrobacter sp. RMG13]|uniref:TnsA-like heteromeric transposase endonuclease subunit n=1 Tax=Pseudarthrobacter humi TaxID=2952523 RepID=A0ABT1LUD9_9MICC|nr:TnsA-like heteromeric transposase endonuclease subunit [Pseudarthrobacter humi]MCP9002090.1 TnsA-like heteromeric transposase endonuclease subunit [Pseudarthrobacter humi]